MRTAHLAICLLFAAGLSIYNSNAQKSNAGTKPNIIFILADDLGYGDIGVYGQQKIETPNIDALAKKGMQFMNYYSGTSVCAPARATFFTGLHTGHAPVRGNKSFQPEGQTPLPDSAVIFANILQQHGYATAAFGKWGLGYITTSGDPAKKGFDKFYGYNCQSLAHNYYPDHLWDNHEKIEFPGNPEKKEVYSAALIHQQALAYIQQVNQPFFLYLPYTLPHAELIVPHDSLYYHYIKKFNEQPDTSGNKYDGRITDPYPRACYAAMVTRLDSYVGEMVKAIEQKGMAENTLIIFASDNGPHKEGGNDPEYFNSNGIYRGIKRDLYEGGIRDPFIAYWPGKIKPGITSQICALWDMYPTFLELASVPLQQKTDGLSIVPTLLQKGRRQQHAYLYWEFHENDGSQAVRWKNWKAVRLKVNKNAEAPIELYDLEKDPSEQNNIAGEHTDIVKKMQAMMNEAHVKNKDWPLLPGEFAGQ
ncbi:arylsulfatase [Parafilimonas sp.]|uniref:arylsulfatase n=1 Tax=Parafilimonas sp. TaxID=1969739 RepID=UPI0039E58C4F